MQEKLLGEFYESLKLDPRMVSYVEAHGTGEFNGYVKSCCVVNIFQM